MKPDGALPIDECDARVAVWLQAPVGAEADRQLVNLVQNVATPIIQRVLGRRFGSQADPTDAQDAASAAREQLTVHLQSLRQTVRAIAPADAPKPIRDFEAYAASVAYSAWTAHFQHRYPQRALLSNRLRHLLEDRQGRLGLAWWVDEKGFRWCGFRAWRDAPPPDAAGAHARGQQLAADPGATLSEVLGRGRDPAREKLETILRALFLWLGGPVEWRTLLDALAAAQGLDQRPVATGEEAGSPVENVADPLPSPHDEVRWREYLRWLWDEAGRLSLRQRTAFLLNAPVVFEWERAGVISIRSLAARLELPPEKLANLWTGLPLDDLMIAALLGVTRQQVINLRRVARDSLGRAWQQWIAH